MIFSKEIIKELKGIQDVLAESFGFNRTKKKQVKAQPFWKPQAGSQELIQKSMRDDSITEIAVHGSRGGGKTFAIVMETCYRIQKYGKKFEGIYLRETATALGEVKELFIDTLKNSIGCTGGGGNNNLLRFHNGARLAFSHFGKDGLDKIKGRNFSDIIIEEADDVLNLKDKLPKALPALRAVHIPNKLVLAYNYSGGSYHYLKNRYQMNGHCKVLSRNGINYISIKSITQENQILLESNKNYLLQFEDLNEKLKQAWLEGNEDVSLGGVAFDSLNEVNNGITWVDDIINRRGLPYVIGIDWGFTDNAVAVFIAMDGHNFIVFDEIVVNNTIPKDFALAILKKLNFYGRAKCKLIAIDPSTEQQHSGHSVREQLYQNGLHTRLAVNDRRGAYLLLYSLIKV